jgi:hypothetical protein
MTSRSIPFRRYSKLMHFKTPQPEALSCILYDSLFISSHRPTLKQHYTSFILLLNFSRSSHTFPSVPCFSFSSPVCFLFPPCRRGAFPDQSSYVCLVFLPVDALPVSVYPLIQLWTSWHWRSSCLDTLNSCLNTDKATCELSRRNTSGVQCKFLNCTIHRPVMNTQIMLVLSVHLLWFIIITALYVICMTYYKHFY